MDMSKYVKQKVNWIFDDTFQTEVLGTFLKAKEYKTNGGKDSDVFEVTIGGTDYLIMPFKVDYIDFVDKLGAETENWKNKPFMLSKNKKGKYQFRLMEESI